MTSRRSAAWATRRWFWWSRPPRGSSQALANQGVEVDIDKPKQFGESVEKDMAR